MAVARAQRLATRALSLARAEADLDASATVIVSMAGGNRGDLILAGARGQAAVDQQRGDRAARRAVQILAAALERA